MWVVSQPDLTGTAQQLVAQQLVRLPAGVQRTSHRRIPCAAPAGLRQADLEGEYNETVRASGMTLKKDPREKPADITVSFDHLSDCTACRNRAGAQRAAHGTTHALLRGHEWQLLADDAVVDTWQSVVRFVSRPSRMQSVLEPKGRDHDAMFGCPCSVAPMPAPARGVMLWHVARRDQRTLFTQCTCARHELITSADGWGNWSAPRAVSMADWGEFGTLAVSPWPGSGALGGGYVGGYEGRGGKACLASSEDGVTWRTIASPEDRAADPFLLLRPIDAILSPLGLHMMNSRSCGRATTSYLGRAADTYVQLLVPPVRAEIAAEIAEMAATITTPWLPPPSPTARRRRGDRAPPPRPAACFTARILARRRAGARCAACRWPSCRARWVT